jgi:hypothetical protein
MALRSQLYESRSNSVIRFMFEATGYIKALKRKERSEPSQGTTINFEDIPKQILNILYKFVHETEIRDCELRNSFARSLLCVVFMIPLDAVQRPNLGIAEPQSRFRVCIGLSIKACESGCRQ